MKSVDVGLDEQHQPSGQRYPARDWQLHNSDRGSSTLLGKDIR